MATVQSKCYAVFQQMEKLSFSDVRQSAQPNTVRVRASIPIQFSDSKPTFPLKSLGPVLMSSSADIGTGVCPMKLGRRWGASSGEIPPAPVGSRPQKGPASLCERRAVIGLRTGTRRPHALPALTADNIMQVDGDASGKNEGGGQERWAGSQWRT